MSNTDTAIKGMVNENRRVGLTLTRQFIVGTYAFMLSGQEIQRRKAKCDSGTHQWSCVLRESTRGDTSPFIKKVVFNLHPSFAVPQRVIEHPPYELTEVGWGEFDIFIKIHFVDPLEKPVEIAHFLKLYQPGTIDIRAVKSLPDSRGPCVAVETVDELIFNCPTEKMCEALQASAQLPPIKYEMQDHFLDQEEKITTYISTATAARALIRRAIDDRQAQIAEISKEIQYYRSLCLEANPQDAEALTPAWVPTPL